MEPPKNEMPTYFELKDSAKCDFKSFSKTLSPIQLRRTKFASWHQNSKDTFRVITQTGDFVVIGKNKRRNGDNYDFAVTRMINQ